MRPVQVLPFLAIVLATSAIAALPKEIDLAKQGKVSFLAVGSPSALKIRGDLKEEDGKSSLQGKLKIEGNQLSGTATAKLDGFDTGIGMRNEHMKKTYLETAKYPDAEVTVDPVTLPEAVLKGESATFPFEGKLTLHGTTKPIKGTVAANGKTFTFEFPVALKDHGVEIPSYLGIKVDKAITVTVEAASAAATL